MGDTRFADAKPTDKRFGSASYSSFKRTSYLGKIVQNEVYVLGVAL